MIDYAGANTPRNRQWPFILFLMGSGLAFGIVTLAFVLPMSNSPRIHENWMACNSRMRQIGMYMLLYANEHKGAHPDSVNSLAAYVILHNDSYALTCPGHSALPASGPTTKAAIEDFNDGGNLSFNYLGGGTTMSVSRNHVLAYEPLNNHGDGLNVLLGDGRVQYLRGSDAKAFSAQIASGVMPLFWPATQPIE